MANKKILMIYDAHVGQPIADGLVENYVTNLISHKNTITCPIHTTSSALVIHTLRACIAEGKVSCDDVIFIFNGDELLPDKDGRLAKWPDGFADHFDKTLDRLLDCGK